jgi:mRNA interferase HigB
VNVISRKKLKTFYDKPEHKKHTQAFEDWYKLSRKARWQNFQDAKSMFGQTDTASDTKSKKTATIFDVGGNKYRILTLIDYTRQTMLITHVLTHKEYDKENWKQDI